MQPLANGLWPARCEVGARGFGTSLECSEPLVEDLKGLWMGAAEGPRVMLLLLLLLVVGGVCDVLTQCSSNLSVLTKYI